MNMSVCWHPGSALQIEGSAFQKISRIDPQGPEGVKHLVEALGGQWGKSTIEEKYHYFEQAVFQVSQKQDESNDSYLARHNAVFEELTARAVTLEEVRAYVLLRHSLLSSEDKRRAVVEANAVLDYKNTVKAVRLLGSRFFNDLQQKNVHGNQKGPDRSKVYDVNMAEEDNNEEIFLADEEFSEEDLVTYMAEQMDEDAIYIAEFEDHIIEALQESDLAPIFTSYQEARQKLREKARSRGFWPPSKGRGKKGPSFTGRKGKGFGKNGGRGRTLAERIANSHCRLCGQAGHCKRECP